MPPLWYVQDRLELSSDYPSGLAWKVASARYKVGEMAGKQMTGRQVFLVYLSGHRYPAHRLVYYLRTGQDPGNSDVLHESHNETKDNREHLYLFNRFSQLSLIESQDG
jgi:hypothetical protein